VEVNDLKTRRSACGVTAHFRLSNRQIVAIFALGGVAAAPPGLGCYDSISLLGDMQEDGAPTDDGLHDAGDVRDDDAAADDSPADDPGDVVDDDRTGEVDGAPDGPADFDSDDDAGDADADSEADSGDSDDADEHDGDPICGNGIVEAPEECDGPATLPCTSSCGSIGTRTCVDCAWGAECRPPPEIGCNGVDDDCDGVIDDGEWCPVDLSLVPVSIEDLYGVHGSGCDDVWAVGLYGVILHWDGASWEAVDAGTTNHLYDVWSFSPSAAWAVGEGAWRWTGSAWEGVDVSLLRPLRAAWGLREDFVWLGGPEFVIFRWDGSTLSAEVASFSRPVREILGFGEADAWMVADDRDLWHWDGLDWSRVRIPVSAAPAAIWGANTDDLWIGGQCYTDGMIHWDGFSWARIEAPCSTSTPGTGILGMFGASASDIWAVGSYGDAQHWDGSTWEEHSTPTDAMLVDVYVCPSGEAWTVGWDATLAHWVPPAP
jgi:hypothetical protein